MNLIDGRGNIEKSPVSSTGAPGENDGKPERRILRRLAAAKTVGLLTRSHCRQPHYFDRTHAHPTRARARTHTRSRARLRARTLGVGPSV